MDKSTCSIEGCGKPTNVRGWCKMHYSRWLRTGTTDPRPRHFTCTIDGCGRKHKARGMCDTHYESSLRTIGFENSATCSFAGCRKIASARGLCAGHRAQQRRGEPLAPLTRRALPIEERFWGNVDKSGPVVPRHPEMGRCWMWTGTAVASKSSGKYGAIKSGKQSIRAHRLSYEIHNGPLPHGMLVDHICHNSLCVRPDHLRPATRSQNNGYLIGPKSNNRSGVRNVHQNKSGNWVVVVKKVYYGTFPTLAKAEAVAKVARAEQLDFADF